MILKNDDYFSKKNLDFFSTDMDLVEKRILSLLPSGDGVLRDVLSGHALVGGKRIRPAIFVLIASMLGCRGDSVITVGSCVEIIHAASLLHDDVVDCAAVRRGKNSANVNFGNAIPVLAGDYFYTKAFMTVLELNSESKLQIIKSLTGAVVKMSENEILQLSVSGNISLNLDTYYRIIEGKTASLFSSLCESAGFLACVDNEIITTLKSYGLNIGFAFQLRDDFLDYFGKEHDTGKKRGADLEERKMTLPLLLLSNHIPDTSMADIVLSNRSLNDKLALLDGYFLEYSIKEQCAEIISNFIEKAIEFIGIFEPSDCRDALIDITKQLRNKVII